MNQIPTREYEALKSVIREQARTIAQLQAELISIKRNNARNSQIQDKSGSFLKIERKT